MSPRTGPLSVGSVALLAALSLAGCSAASPESPPTAPRAVAVAVPAVASSAAGAQVARATVPQAHRGGLYAGRVRAYGDSVMLGARWALQHRLHARVNAAESRQCGALVSLVRRDYRAGRIHGPVVIHTGTNGTYAGCPLAAIVAKVSRQHLVVLVNVKLPARYSWTSSDNRTLARIDRRSSHVVLLDWRALGAAHPGWFYGDGIHLTPSGRTGYAAAVARTLRR